MKFFKRSIFLLSTALLLPSINAQSAPPAGQSVNDTATCGSEADVNAVLQATNSISAAGAEIGVTVGINANYGGVGVRFGLKNLQANQELDILEARSSAGAGMQFDYTLYNGADQHFIFNQAAGNSVPYQWGMPNTYTGGATYLNAVNWVSMYNDSHTVTSVGGGFYPATPCDVATLPHRASIDVGALDMAVGVETNATVGNIVSLTAAYTLQSKYNQYWSNPDGQAWQARHAFYMNRANAANASLKFYLGDSGSGMPARGPYLLAQGQEVKRFVDENGGIAYFGKLADGTSANGSDTYKTEYAVIAGATGRYAAFVWYLWGKEAIVVIPDVSKGATLGAIGNAYPGSTIPGGSCPTSAATTIDPHCGSLQWWTNVYNAPGSYSIPDQGQRSLSTTYYVGTRQQLANYGFVLPAP